MPGTKNCFAAHLEQLHFVDPRWSGHVRFEIITVLFAYDLREDCYSTTSSLPTKRVHPEHVFTPFGIAAPLASLRIVTTYLGAKAPKEHHKKVGCVTMS